MGYLEEFQHKINDHDFPKFFQLWEEYCTGATTSAEEFIQLLDLVKRSDFVKLFGQFAETALPLWSEVKDEEAAYNICKRLVDMQTTNSPVLADAAYRTLEKRYGSDPKFKERIRQVGLLTRENFQSAISNYELLAHLQKGNFVFHTSGWGTGEVVDISSVREQAAIEFENVTGIKHLAFDTAYKTLVPLSKEHFLARRFADPDLLEQQARQQPEEVLHELLKDLGPKTAAEIKEEMAEVVIPESDWSRWWQTARAKLKRDPRFENPATLKDPFTLREEAISETEELHLAIGKQEAPGDIIQASYAFARDMPQMLRKPEVKETLKEKLVGLLSHEHLTEEQELQICIFLENMFGHKVEGRSVEEFIKRVDNIEELINRMEIAAFKKRALTMVRESRSDWPQLFAALFFTVNPGTLRDYIVKELTAPEGLRLLDANLKELLKHPKKYPEVFLWYFQKIAKKTDEELPYSDKEGQCKFLEAFLILLYQIEHEPEYKDITKKMYNLLIAKRFAIVRYLIEGSSLEFIKEYLLLVAKCHIFTENDKKILRSLAQVVHPSLAPQKERGAEKDSDVIWTTEQGYLKIQDRIKEIATVEMIENAREVEAARALGDLRENAEYKFAVERRGRLQGEMKALSKQLNKARILTPLDIAPGEVGVGSIVELEDSKGNKLAYTLLGPWDTQPEEHIISYQSNLALAMTGCKLGEAFSFRDEQYKIVGINSFLR